MQEPFVLYEDEQIIVINKPNGLVTTPGAGYEESETLVGWLISRYGDSLRSVGTEAHRPGIVHRLDKDTSGAMVCVKTQMAFESLIHQFSSREVKKEYLAVTWGDITSLLPEGQEHFAINAPIGRNPRNRQRFTVINDGREAHTDFEVNGVGELHGQKYSVVTAYPKSGRTHQIRVHLKALGDSIIGDRFYQSKKELEQFRIFVEEGIVDRLYLHARSISFVVPGTDEMRTFESELPEEFEEFVE